MEQLGYMCNMVGFAHCEEWLPVVDLEEFFEVSSFGRIRRLPRIDRLGRQVQAKVLVNARMSGRYLRIRLRVHNAKYERFVHHIVLESFVGPRPSGMWACHNNDDRNNNALSNLRWDIPSANSLDSVRN